jgi:CRP-like cAMP-binding protein
LDSFWGNIFRQSDEESVYTLLRDIPLFDGLSSSELAEVKAILHRREYEPGEVLFHQGNPGVGMYIIQEGTIEIVDETTGDTLVELSDGDFFGELALLNETPRSATAEAQTESVLYGLFRPDLLGLVDRDPTLGVQILMRMSRVISERLVQTNETVRELRERLHDLSGETELSSS